MIQLPTVATYSGVLLACSLANLSAQTVLNKLPRGSVGAIVRGSEVAAGDFDGDSDLDLWVDRFTLLDNDGGRFTPSTTQPGPSANALGAYDFNADGRADLLEYDTSAGQLIIALNDLQNTGTFTRSSFPVSRLPGHLVADFDRDGDLDVMATTSTRNPRITYLQNDGSGTFSDVTASHLPAQNPATTRLYALDAEGDGDLDLVLSGFLTAGERPFLLENNGTGVFTTPAQDPFPSAPAQVYGTIDADGDGDEDVLVGRTLTVYENQGGTFVVPASPLIPPLPPTLNFVVVGDLDGDGDEDLWWEGTDPVRWIENVGGGAPFVDRMDRVPQLRRTAAATIIEDFDGDGRADVLSALPEFGALQVLVGQPGGTFVESAEPSVSPRATQFADFDGNGTLDHMMRRGQRIAMQLGDGLGRFTEIDAITGSFPTLGPDFVADVDGDGDIDVLTSDRTSFISPFATIMKNDGSGRLTPATGSVSPAISRLELARFGDLDNDGDLDLFAHFVRPSSSTDPDSYIFENDGTGNFNRVPTALTGLFDATLEDAELFDADGDGDLDLAVVIDFNGVSRVPDPSLFLNDGAGNFTELVGAFPASGATFIFGGGADAISIADFDDDNDQDVVVRYGDDAVGLLFLVNDGTGRFSIATQNNSIDFWFASELIDIDDDGDSDLIALVDSSTLGSSIGPLVLENDGAGNFSTTTKTFFLAGNFLGALVDIDQDGDIDMFSRLGLVANLTRHLSSPVRPRLGKSLELEIYSAGATVPSPGSILISAARLTAPIEVPDIGRLLVDPTAGAAFGVSIPGGDTPARVEIPVRMDPALVGFEVFGQGVVTDGSGISSLRLTNGYSTAVIF